MAGTIAAPATMGSTGRADTDLHLVRLMEEVGRALDLVAIYEAALTCLCQTLKVERAAVLLFDDTETMRFVASRGLSPEYRKAVEGHTPWRPQQRDTQPIIVPDVQAEPSLEMLRPALEREGIGALAFISLTFSGTVLGKFMVYYDEPHVLSPDEITVARLVAGHVAFAIAHRRVEEALEGRLRAEQQARRQAEREIALRQRLQQRQALLVEAGQILSRSLDFDEVLRALSEIVVPRFADWYAVHLVDDDGKIAPVHIGHIDPKRVEGAWEAVRRWPARTDGPGGLADVISTGRSMWVAQVPDEILVSAARDADHLKFLRDAGIGSLIIVPLAVSGRTIGSMTFVSGDPDRNYASADVQLAEALSNQAASAIDNARLFREAKHAHATAEAAAARLDALVKVSESIAPSLDPDAALEALAQFCASSLADYCVTYRLDKNGGIHRVGLAHADPAQQALVEELVSVADPRLEHPHGAGAVLRTGKPILAPEIPKEMLARAAEDSRHFDVLRKLGPRSSLVVPLNARGRTVGALALAATDRTGRRYDEDDLALAQELAARAALLVDNARLYREASEAKRAMDEMLATVSHDLRDPLNAIVVASEALELDVAQSRKVKMRASIRRAAKQMSKLLEDLLDVTRLEGGRLALSIATVDLGALVDGIVTMHGPVAEDRSIRLVAQVPDEIVQVNADRDRTSQALTNLLGNALKFTPAGGEVRVTLQRRGSQARIGVADTGPGIPADQLEHLFDRFWRADRESRAGVGLGLTIAKGIADAHGGTIEVHSTPGKGSQFTLVLPTGGPGGS